MKRLCAGLAAVTFIVSSLVSPVMGKGIFITPGVRANGLGGAYVGIANDPTAIYWNPAGLAQLDGSGAEASFFYTASDATSNQTPGNSLSPNTENGDFALGDIYGIMGSVTSNPVLSAAEPESYDSGKTFETTALVPFISGYTRVKDIVIAVGVYGIGGGGGKWTGTAESQGALTPNDSIKATLEALQAFSIYNISASRAISEKVMVGLGVDMVNMTDNVTLYKEYTLGTGSALAGAGLNGYSARVDLSAKGSGIQVNGGVLYKASEKLQTGIVVRSGTTINLDGKARLLQTNLSSLGYPASFETNYDHKYNYPMTYCVGASYAATKKLLVAASLDFNNYSSIKDDDITYETELTGLFVNGGEKTTWKDTTQFRVGAEYSLTDIWLVRAGIQNDPVPYSRDELSLFNTNQYDMIYYTLGTGYRINALDLNLAAARGVSDTPSKDGRSFEYPINILRFSAAYRF